jgi:hypothetical protein
MCQVVVGLLVNDNADILGLGPEYLDHGLSYLLYQLGLLIFGPPLSYADADHGHMTHLISDVWSLINHFPH